MLYNEIASIVKSEAMVRSLSVKKGKRLMELTAMKNIGAEMKKKLSVIDIHSAKDLFEMGSKEAFFRLKTAYPEVCLVHLYTLQGGH